MAKMIQEIISIPRADSGYLHNFMVNSWVFKDDESESEAKTNSGSWVCPLLVKGPHFACVEHAQCLLLAHAHALSHLFWKAEKCNLGQSYCQDVHGILASTFL